MSKKKDPVADENIPAAEENTPETEVPAEEPTAEQLLAEELAAAKDQYLRLYAEYDNFRKRTQKEKEAIYGDAAAKTVEAILPVIDNLDRAVDAAKSAGDLESFKQGVEMTLRQFIDILAKLDVHEVPAEGQPFDPNVHHAVMHIDDESIAESTVVEVFQKGYILGDRTIRPAMVKVAN